MAPGGGNAEGDTVGQGDRIVAVALCHQQPIGSVIEDYISRTVVVTKDSEQPIAYIGKFGSVAPAQVRRGWRKAKRERRAARQQIFRVGLLLPNAQPRGRH